MDHNWKYITHTVYAKQQIKIIGNQLLMKIPIELKDNTTRAKF